MANISVRLSGRMILDAVSLTLAPGEIVVIAGPNGAGKSTLLGVIAGAILDFSGRVAIDREDIAGLDAEALAQRRAVLEQNPVGDLPYTVCELVTFGIHAAVPPIEAAHIRMNCIQRMGLAAFETRRIFQMSGGEIHRAHLARVLAQLASGRYLGCGRYLLVDEPTASLDLQYQVMVLQQVRLAAAAGAGCLVILHDLTLAAAVAHRIVLLSEGRVAADGAPSVVLTADRLERVYGLPITVAAVDGRQVVLPWSDEVVPRKKHGEGREESIHVRGNEPV